MINQESIRSQEKALLNELRAAKGLSPKSYQTKFFRGTEVLKGPDRAQVTEYKDDKEFTRLNMNGSDTWGYWHPTDNPEIIYNFRGEPNYRTCEIAPEYYQVAKERAREAKDKKKRLEKQARSQDYRRDQDAYFEQSTFDGGRIYLAFRDRRTDQYFVGFHDIRDGSNNFYPTASKDKSRDYLLQHDQPEPEIIETWDYEFQPDNPAVFDPWRRFINQFIKSKYMKNARKVDGATVPPAIMRVIRHALGGNVELVEHFLNWLAVIFQHRIHTQTAWVLQGTTGTGKGLLFSKIIQPLIGEDYCRLITLPNLEDGFNKFMEHCLVLFVDEVDTDQVRDMPKLTARLKNMITEPRIPVRAMRTDLREVPNHLNLLMASNQPNSMRIEDNDRRFNVCPRQEEKLLAETEIGEELVSQITEELPAFADYLQSRNTDIALARQALDNEAKRELQVITQTAIEEVAEALREGNLEYFFNHTQETDISIPQYFFDNSPINTKSSYRQIIKDAIDCCLAGESHVLIHRDLFVLFDVLVGKMPTTKTKLTKRLGHHRIVVKSHTLGTSSKRGFKTKWQASKEDLIRWQQFLTEKTKPKVRSVK